MAKVFSPKKFEALVLKTNKELARLADVKGGEYSGVVDRLANFRRVGAATGVNKETALMVYMTKHWDALQTYVKDLQTGTERPRSEALAGRVHDLMVYSLLLLAMLEEGADADE